MTTVARALEGSFLPAFVDVDGNRALVWRDAGIADDPWVYAMFDGDAPPTRRMVSGFASREAALDAALCHMAQMATDQHSDMEAVEASIVGQGASEGAVRDYRSWARAMVEEYAETWADNA